VCDTRLELEKEAQATERRVLVAGPLNKNEKKALAECCERAPADFRKNFAAILRTMKRKREKKSARTPATKRAHRRNQPARHAAHQTHSTMQNQLKPKNVGPARSRTGARLVC